MKKTILTLLVACVFGFAHAGTIDETAKVTKDISLIEDFELNSFCKAIMKGDVDLVKKMIALGEDVNQKSLGMAPVHFAARYNKAEILEVLLANGANIKKRCDKGYTAKKHAELSNATEALEVIEAAMKK
ncbi:ankyrin repeat domain-containing protein [Allomuricauda sp. SCSIO 65647]|uniref:ankyrin repeat domain-containing protein n=1 Tax=Allomuricauda sp. SCSIO 65647 TaxID=2908843 RepID=UPI001F1EE4AB|nr:ankyrin repeat domain-containing protein [Muricauda sp. SCSIO 65647]UJH68156.1 ankyrin repeat domain-containing protein [Muricauda sp. SCSIO 65647]